MRTKRKKRYIISPMPGIYKVFLKSSCHHSEMCFLLMSETLSPLQSGLGANGPCRRQPPLLHKIPLSGLIIGALRRGARLSIITALVPSL